MRTLEELRSAVGDIDIYLFDQVLKGRLQPPLRLLDAGCGGGRNLVWLLNSGVEVFAVDRDPQAVSQTRALAAALAPELAPGNFRVAEAERLDFPDDHFGAVVAIALLHFARDRAHWDAMLDELLRVLAPDGLLFTRIATSIGIESELVARGGGRFLMPDGSERFLLGESELLAAMATRGLMLVEPLKTVLVLHQRSMCTWVVRRRPA